MPTAMGAIQAENPDSSLRRSRRLQVLMYRQQAAVRCGKLPRACRNDTLVA